MNKNRWDYQSNLYEAINNADAVILLTEWEIYKNIDWERVSSNVKKPFWVFDTRFILQEKKLKELGINIWQLGNSYRNQK